MPQSGEVSNFVAGQTKLGKRSTRGYNPKYDGQNTQFLTGEAIKATKISESMLPPKSYNDVNIQRDENGELKVNKHGQPVRKVGRPPKDRSLM